MGMPSIVNLVVGIIFVAAGFALGLGFGLLLRRMTPRLGRGPFVALVVACVMVTTVLVPPVVSWVSDSPETGTLGYLTRLAWREWSMFAVEAFAAMLVARRLAPQPGAKVDPAVFD